MAHVCAADGCAWFPLFVFMLRQIKMEEKPGPPLLTLSSWRSHSTTPHPKNAIIFENDVQRLFQASHPFLSSERAQSATIYKRLRSEGLECTRESIHLYSAAGLMRSYFYRWQHLLWHLVTEFSSAQNMKKNGSSEQV